MASSATVDVPKSDGPPPKPKTAARYVVAAAVLSILAALFGPELLPRDVSEMFFGERCNEMWIKRNVTALTESMEQNVFGQHVAVRLVLSALMRRWSVKSYQPEKPLVMSFHGWTGSGKNYVAKFIAEAWFEKGLSSASVSLLSSTLHFHDPGKVSQYRETLQHWVRTNVSRCPESLFIIDEVDKMPPGVLDGLKPYMDFHEKVDGVDFRKSTFILLSNTGGRQITRKVLDFFHRGRIRETIMYSDLEGLVSKGAFNEGGGLFRSSLIEKSLIDVYVPFLPLEARHVRLCVEKELRDRRVTGYPPGLPDRAVQELQFWPEDIELFASSGCKRARQKVDELLYVDE